VAQRLTANIRVQRFGLDFDTGKRRLEFPHAEVGELAGQLGRVQYSASELHFEELKAILDRGQWQAASASAGAGALRDTDGRFELGFGRIEFPRGLLATRAVAAGGELLAPHASLSDVTIKLRGPFRRHPPNAVPAAVSTAETQPMTVVPPPGPEPGAPLRQERLRFLDGVSGEIKLTIKVKLDLPVVGSRSLDQKLVIPIQDGSLDFRALDEGLDWLEGTFLDIGLDGERLAVKWRVPVIASREIISWALDPDALTLAKFDRVPLRALADFRIARRKDKGDKDKDKPSRLEAFSIEGVECKLSLTAPRSLEVGGGAIMFGGEGSPGIVDLSILGELRSPGAGALGGSIALVDATIKDLHFGGLAMTADRLHLGSIDHVEVRFDGFTPAEITAKIDRATATNLALVLGRRRAGTYT
jgi:hypothetical protein